MNNLVKTCLSSLLPALFLLFSNSQLKAQHSENITFMHDNLKVYGTFSRPSNTGRYPVIIIDPGSGPNDRNATVSIGSSATEQCLFPKLFNNVLRPYQDLANALVDSGYAVLRYDKLEYTYTDPKKLGPVTLHKLWLPVVSAVDYVKTRADVDTNHIILIGHSEGSYFIPYIARKRKDIRALISIAGPRRPFDSLLAYQVKYIARHCNQDTNAADYQAAQILGYYNMIRNKTYDASTPDLFGAPAKVWDDYLQIVDSVAINYNLAAKPTLFLNFGSDYNVPPTELAGFKRDVSNAQFWPIPGLIHFMTTDSTTKVAPIVPDTIIYWLRQNVFAGIESRIAPAENIKVQRLGSELIINSPASFIRNCTLYSMTGTAVRIKDHINAETVNLEISGLPQGIYILTTATASGFSSRKISIQ